MGQGFDADIGNPVARAVAHLHPLFGENAKSAFAPPRQQKPDNQRLQPAMKIFPHVPLHKLPLQILHVRVVSGAEIFFNRHGGGRRHAFSIGYCLAWARFVFPARYHSSHTRIVKVAISLPDQLFQHAEAAAKARRISRSQLYATALADFLEQHQPREITERLDAIYGKKTAKVDRVLNHM